MLTVLVIGIISILALITLSTCILMDKQHDIMMELIDLGSKINILTKLDKDE